MDAAGPDEVGERVARQVLEGQEAVAGGDGLRLGVDHTDLTEPRPLQQRVEELDPDLADQGHALVARQGRGGLDDRLLPALAGHPDQRQIVPVGEVGARLLTGAGDDLAVLVEEVQRLVAGVLAQRLLQQRAAGVGVVRVDQPGRGHQVRLRLVERPAHPVGDQVGTVALVRDHAGRDADGVVGAVQQEADGQAPQEQQYGGQRERTAHPEPPLDALTPAGITGRAAQLRAQPLQGGTDARGLAPAGHVHRAGQVAPGQSAGLQEQPQQRPLHGRPQHGGGEQSEHHQGSGRQQPVELPVRTGGLLPDHGQQGDDGEPEARADALLLLRVGGGEGGVTGGGDTAVVALPDQGPADPGVAAGARFPGADRVLLGLPCRLGGQPAHLLLEEGQLLALLVGVERLGLLEAGRGEDLPAGGDDRHGTELAQVDGGHGQAVGGEQQLLRPVVEVEDRHGHQAYVAGLQPHHAGLEGRVPGEDVLVQPLEGNRFPPGGQHLAALQVQDGGARPLLVRLAQVGQDTLGLDRRPRVQRGGGAVQVGDPLVDRGTQGDGAVLREVLLRREHRLRYGLLAGRAEHLGGEAREGQHEDAQQRDRGTDAAEQRHVRASSTAPPSPLHGALGAGGCHRWSPPASG
ncbi:hypothetical protein STAFG_3686 [Streptomyces afghaniensis 772]|uniref:Uncharacterized protein n=1 Tax=Streptomyces afghaniensis 772 TaxID=1283301 RepID=S4MRC4_9ACTN|nr:hypothetical protein STAFG_3686 [Streptomyces afghaniensis 772]